VFLDALAQEFYPPKEGALKRGQNRKHAAPETKTRLALQLVLLAACRQKLSPDEAANAKGAGTTGPHLPRHRQPRRGASSPRRDATPD